MGINIKYYIISIASIFISLGIGIFIGFNMNGHEIYLKQQQALVDSLENRFVEFKKEKEILELSIQNLNSERESQSVFIEGMFQEIIDNKLVDLNVAIIETSDSYFYDDINETLQAAGAVLPLGIKYMNKIYNVREDDLQEINNSLNIYLEDKEDLINLVNNEIANSLIYGGINHTLEFLAGHQYIEYNYNPDHMEEMNIDKIIIAGGDWDQQNSKIEQTYIPLIETLQNHQLDLIGVERSDVEQSSIPTFKQFDISTVDNIDSKVGKISLIYLLDGVRGHYGEKPTANSLAPFITSDTAK